MPPTDDDRTLDRLCGAWWIWQLRRGHRYTTDDAATAWMALRARPAALTVLDLGAGVGSIGLMALWGLPRARLVSVEAQAVSADLLRRSVTHNGLEQRVTVVEADLRGPELLGSATFDLVLANPPYLPAGSATPSPHPQRAAARLEQRGGVVDFVAVAARHLAPGGALVLCGPTADARPARALALHGLVEERRLDLAFRQGRAPFLTVRVAGRGSAVPRAESFAVRGADGGFTEAWGAVRSGLAIA